jgi:hypothetical protein
VLIDPNHAAPLETWAAYLHLAATALPRAARRGQLRTARRGGKLWATGEWIAAWLAAGEAEARLRRKHRSATAT